MRTRPEAKSPGVEGRVEWGVVALRGTLNAPLRPRCLLGLPTE